MEGLIIRQAASSSEVQGFIQWGIDEGWNMPTRDPVSYFESYPEGWLIAEKVGDEIVGKLYSTAYPSGLGHIGYIIVRKECRGKGVGTALLRHCLDNYLKRCQLGVGLYSAEEELPFYKNLGFAVVQKIFRMSRTTLVRSELHDEKEMKSADYQDENVVVVRNMDNHSEAELEAVAQYDAKLSGAYRPKFWAQFPKSHVTLVLSPGGDEIMGVGAIRPLTKNTRLGPIYAHSPSIASKIISRLLDQVVSDGGGEVTLDAFSDNEDAIKLFECKGFKTWNEAFLLLRPSPASGVGVAGGPPKKMTYAGAVTPSSGSYAPPPPHPSALNHKNIYCITSLDFN